MKENDKRKFNKGAPRTRFACIKCGEELVFCSPKRTDKNGNVTFTGLCKQCSSLKTMSYFWKKKSVPEIEHHIDSLAKQIGLLMDIRRLKLKGEYYGKNTF